MMSEHWPRGTLVTRLYERDSLALSLIRSSGETRAHRSPSARPAFLTVRRLLYSNGFLPPFSSAEFCSAYQTLMVRSSSCFIATTASPIRRAFFKETIFLTTSSKPSTTAFQSICENALNFCALTRNFKVSGGRRGANSRFKGVFFNNLSNFTPLTCHFATDLLYCPP